MAIGPFSIRKFSMMMSVQNPVPSSLERRSGAACGDLLLVGRIGVAGIICA